MALLPWYKWYQSDWLTSETRFEMTLAERGLYRDLLDIHYSEGSIPADVRKLRAMVGAQKGFARAWAHVQKFFEPHPSDPSRLVNTKALQVIENRLHKGNASRENGCLGGRPRKRPQKPTRFSLGSENKPASRARVSDTDTDTEPPYSPPTGDGGIRASVDGTRLPDDAFEQIARAYPNPRGRSRAWTQWQTEMDKLGWRRKSFDAMLRAAKTAAKIPKDRQRFVCKGLDWFVSEGYADDWEATLEFETGGRGGEFDIKPIDYSRELI